MDVRSQLKNAQIEQRASSPTKRSEIVYNTTSNEVEVMDNVGAKALVTKTGTQTLTNKTLTGNTAANLISGSGTLTLNTTGTATVPNATDTLVGKATSDILTNKSIDADTNTITNIENADIKAAAAIALNKLAATTVSRALVSDGSGFVSPATTTSTEIGFVNGVTSSIQTQLNARQLRSTLTTKGDLYVATASDTVTRLPAGTDGQVLTADSSLANGVKYASVASLNNLGVVSKTTTFTATTAEDVILCSAAGGAYTGTLYTAVGNSGRTIRFVKTGSDTSAVTVDASGTETIGGGLTMRLVLTGDSLTIISDGTNWQILVNEIKVTAYSDQKTITGTLTTTQSVGIFGSMDRDTHAAYNTTTGLYTVPYSGVYFISAKVDIVGVTTAINTYAAVGIRINGVGVAENFSRTMNTATTQQTVFTSISIYLAAEDTVALGGRSSFTTPTYTTGLSGANFSITRIM